MHITIHATQEEIAGLVFALQDRQSMDDIASKVQQLLQAKIMQADTNRQGVWPRQMPDGEVASACSAVEALFRETFG